MHLFIRLFHKSRKRYRATFLFVTIFLTTILTIWGYANICQYQSYSYSEKIDYAIHHKFFFKLIYKIKSFYKHYFSYFSQKKQTSKLREWFEKRIMHYLNDKNITGIHDLPWLERALIKTFDAIT